MISRISKELIYNNLLALSSTALANYSLSPTSVCTQLALNCIQTYAVNAGLTAGEEEEARNYSPLLEGDVSDEEEVSVGSTRPPNPHLVRLFSAEAILTPIIAKIAYLGFLHFRQTSAFDMMGMMAIESLTTDSLAIRPMNKDSYLKATFCRILPVVIAKLVANCIKIDSVKVLRLGIIFAQIAFSGREIVHTLKLRKHQGRYQINRDIRTTTMLYSRIFNLVTLLSLGALAMRERAK